MNCRRCNTDRNVCHFHNDLFDGWFCPGCVDEVVDQEVARIMRSIRPKREDRPLLPARSAPSSGSSVGKS